MFLRAEQRLEKVNGLSQGQKWRRWFGAVDKNLRDIALLPLPVRRALFVESTVCEGVTGSGP
jgi:hypothetical protein